MFIWQPTVSMYRRLGMSLSLYGYPTYLNPSLGGATSVICQLCGAIIACWILAHTRKIDPCTHCDELLAACCCWPWSWRGQIVLKVNMSFELITEPGLPLDAPRNGTNCLPIWA